jgi:hypothetical protein
LVERVYSVHEDEDDEDEDDDEESKLKPGEIEISYGESFIKKNHKYFTVEDRSFLHGDICCWLDDPQGMSGSVVEVNIIVSVKTNKKM